MFRKMLTAVAIVELVRPEALIDAAEQIALENPDECELQSWVVPGTRLEGLVFLGLVWRSDRSYSQFKKFLGCIGVLALVYPRAYIDYASRLAYTDTTTCEWKPWVYAATRCLGMCYLLIAVNELRKK